MRILVVDDEPGILRIVTQFLTSSTHHEALPASSAKEALEAISNAEDPFDCFLIDIQMPTVNGIELVGLIRQIPGYQHTPIIMLTAMREKLYLDRAFSAGATDYVGKPFDYEDLRQRLQDAQRLSIDKTRQQSQPISAGEFKGMGGEPKQVRLSDPIQLPAVETAVDYGEFENYVRQLLRRKFARATTIAAKIGGIDRIYADCSTSQFRSWVRDAATVLQETLLANGGILSYRGNGVFICIPEKRLKGRRDTLQTALNKRYHLLHPPTGDIASNLLVGDQVALNSGSDAQALDCLAKAVHSVENQSSGFADIFDLPRRLFRSARLNDEQKRLEKRAFEFLLRDTPAGPKNDAWQRHLSRRESPPDNT